MRICGLRPRTADARKAVGLVLMGQDAAAVQRDVLFTRMEVIAFNKPQSPAG
jgi:hypothetical protein